MKIIYKVIHNVIVMKLIRNLFSTSNKWKQKTNMEKKNQQIAFNNIVLFVQFKQSCYIIKVYVKWRERVDEQVKVSA